jgi:hypothetical protein
MGLYSVNNKNPIMDLIKTNLKKTRKVLSNIEIRKSPQVFTPEDIDFILKSNPNIQVPTVNESIITPNEIDEGFVELSLLTNFFYCFCLRPKL